MCIVLVYIIIILTVSTTYLLFKTFYITRCKNCYWIDPRPKTDNVLQYKIKRKNILKFFDKVSFEAKKMHKLKLFATKPVISKILTKARLIWRS